MAVVVFPAIVTPLPGGGLRAYFADFPGAELEASSAADLIQQARQWLHGELQRLEQAGDTWPEPSAAERLSLAAGDLLVLVDVSVEDTPIRLTISIGERLLKRIDQDADARSMTRSGYLALGARRMLAETGPSDLGGDRAGKTIEDEIEALRRRFNEVLGPNSQVGRTLNDLDTMAMDGLRRLGSAIRPRKAAAKDAEVVKTPDDQAASV